MLRDLQQVLQEEWRGATTHGVRVVPRDDVKALRLEIALIVFRRRPRPDHHPARGVVQCHNALDYAIRPPDPNIIMGGPEMQLHHGDEHPLLAEFNAPRARLNFKAPPPNPVEAAVAMWAAHAAESERAGRLPIPPLPHPATLVEQLAAGNGYSLGGSQPLVKAYLRALRRLGVDVEGVITAPHGQYLPGGDGEMYDPPMNLKLLVIDQTYVVAETFLVEDDEDASPRP